MIHIVSNLSIERGQRWNGHLLPLLKAVVCLVWKTRGEKASYNETMKHINRRENKECSTLVLAKQHQIYRYLKILPHVETIKDEKQKKVQPLAGEMAKKMPWSWTFTLLDVEKVDKMFLRQAWRRCVHCTPCAHPSENGSHTINPAKCYLPKAAFVAWRLFAESKHMPNVHVICSPNRGPSCVALTHCAKQCEQKQHTLPQRIH